MKTLGRSRSLILLASLSLASTAALCKPNTPVPPKPPAPRTVVVIVEDTKTLGPVQDADVSGLRPGVVTKTNSEGQAIVVDVAGDLVTYDLLVRKDGYFDTVIPGRPVPPRDVSDHVTLSPRPPPVNPTNAGEAGALSIADANTPRARFVRPDGSTFKWLGFSDFAILQRFLHGEDIDKLLVERVNLGATILRVFSMFEGAGIGSTGISGSGLGELSPRTNPEMYDRLPLFADLLAARGLRFELTVLADAQNLMPDRAAQQAHVDRVAAALAGKWNVVFELVNEPFKNGVDPSKLRVPAAWLTSAGNYADVVSPVSSIFKLQYFTLHTERKPEWVRTARSSAEMRDGFDWTDAAGNVIGTWQGVHIPVVNDEPTGFAEVARPDSRSDDVDDATHYAAVSMMMGAGATFHSDDGIGSRLLGARQTLAAKAWFAAMRWIPADAQFAPYMRGAANGGPGIGDMPLQHFDLDVRPTSGALRTYCKASGGAFYCSASRRGIDWKAEPLRGCTVVEQPDNFTARPSGLVKLVCPSSTRVH